jgi:hypothetical protein
LADSPTTSAEAVAGRGWFATADVFAKGAIRHPDHATIDLAGWHRVLMNTEQHARAMQHVVFLD